MTAKASLRLIARLRPCPTCGSPSGVSCAGKRGERKSVHRARLAGAPPTVVIARRSAEEFYRSDEWRRLRYKALRKYGGKCQCCGAPPALNAPLHVDHIKPRSRFPELALDIDNLQVLCEDCNLGKGASDTTDWRPL